MKNLHGCRRSRHGGGQGAEVGLEWGTEPMWGWGAQNKLMKWHLGRKLEALHHQAESRWVLSCQLLQQGPEWPGLPGLCESWRAHSGAAWGPGTITTQSRNHNPFSRKDMNVGAVSGLFGSDSRCLSLGVVIQS